MDANYVSTTTKTIDIDNYSLDRFSQRLYIYIFNASYNNNNKWSLHKCCVLLATCNNITPIKTSCVVAIMGPLTYTFCGIWLLSIRYTYLIFGCQKRTSTLTCISLLSHGERKKINRTGFYVHKNVFYFKLY